MILSIDDSAVSIEEHVVVLGLGGEHEGVSELESEVIEVSGIP